MDSKAADLFRTLIEKAKNGEEAAFSELYLGWYAPVYRFVLLRVRVKETAEDLTQDVFLKVFAHLDRFELKAAHPLGFLFTTARNCVIDYHKKKKPERLDDEAALQVKDELARTPEELSVLRDDVDNLKEAIRTLTREQQDVVTLRLIEEKSVKEVADILEKSEEAVRQLQVRALRALKLYFDEHHLG